MIVIRRMSRLTDSYYRILELSPGASKQEIKASYTRLVKQCHPDVTTNINKHEAANQFKLIHEAREKLLGIKDDIPGDINEPLKNHNPATQSHYTTKDYEEFKKKQDEWLKSGKNKYEEQFRNDSSNWTKNDYEEFRKKQDEYIKNEQKMHEESERQEQHKKHMNDVWEAHKAKYANQKVRSTRDDGKEILGSLLFLAGLYLIICQLRIIKRFFFEGNRGMTGMAYASTVDKVLEDRNIYIKSLFWSLEYSTYDREFIIYESYDGTNHSRFVKYGNEDNKKYKCYTCQERMASMELVKNHVEKYNPDGPQGGHN